MSPAFGCAICGESLTVVDAMLIGSGGACRDPFNPNQDDEGLHIAEPYGGEGA